MNVRMGKEQMEEFECMEQYIEDVIYPLFIQMDNKIKKSGFSQIMISEMRAKIAYGICQEN